MPSLFAAAPALVPCPSASSPDVVVVPALVPCPSASALPCRRCRRRHLSLAHQRPPLPSSSRQLSSLARQRPPSPALVVATGTCPLPVIILACRHRRASSCPLPVSVCPHLPLLLPPLPPTAADAPGRSLPSAGALAVPLPLSPSLQPQSSSAVTIIVATKPSLLPPPPSNLVLFGRSTFSRTEESYHQEVRSKRVLNLFTAQI